MNQTSIGGNLLGIRQWNGSKREHEGPYECLQQQANRARFHSTMSIHEYRESKKNGIKNWRKMKKEKKEKKRKLFFLRFKDLKYLFPDNRSILQNQLGSLSLRK